jgi:RNA polymerase sigma-70 factor (ECF subfamily)
MAGSDRRLARRLGRGDKDALAEVYREQKDRLLTLAYRLLADRAAAEDCLQDVFLRLARDAANLRIRGRLGPYLASCVLNRARDELRKGGRAVHVSLSQEHEGPSSGPDPSLAVEESDRSTRIQEALSLLPSEQREVVVLHLNGDLTFRQIGEMQSVSIHTAKSRYRYGIQRLRGLLSRQEEG